MIVFGVGDQGDMIGPADLREAMQSACAAMSAKLQHDTSAALS